ncbi:dTDP-glucose 4,6-dehydratase [Shewanella goraebulensis]|uniref:dTDP-glucose 4,6-dehydratase n=1 Tax=Shewanella goraebulensis TaxID=3050637 RepID=UPI00254A9045|nr:dTDP-glucose 4,6-dehydratase [Shewanella goraebulensis]
MNPRNILVTGGAGFIGASFTHYWLNKFKNDRIIVLDLLTYAGNMSNLSQCYENNRFEFIWGDIGNSDLVESILVKHSIDTIVHFAAESHVDRSILSPDAFIQTNINGTFSLLNAAKKVWIDTPKENNQPVIKHRFHHVSTDEVYGSLLPNEAAFTELTPYSPNSPYSASKAASDHLVRSYLHTYGLQVTTSNCSNNYGSFHFPEKLIPLVITNVLQNKSIPIYGDGKQIRDWLYVDDHALGIELVLNKGKVGETYNIGGNNEWTNIDIVKLICSQIDLKFAENSYLREKYPQAFAALSGDSASLVRFVTDRPGHDKRYAIDASKSESELNYRPTKTFEEGIVMTLDWYLTNDDWWQSIIDGSYLETNSKYMII